MTPPGLSTLSIADLLDAYRARRFTPRELLTSVLDQIDAASERNVWISGLPRERVLGVRPCARSHNRRTRCRYTACRSRSRTTLISKACRRRRAAPPTATRQAASAFVVQRLIDAGAMPMGKTNLDQFATGLVGTRSPYGACQNAVDAEYVSGGSSSGSAVAVASGLVSFSLGTDTAGRGVCLPASTTSSGSSPRAGI